MTPRIRAWAIAVVVALMLPARAYAQEHNTIAIGLNFSNLTADDASAHGSHAIGLLCRVGHQGGGWGWQYGLNWYATDLDRQIGGHQTPFGELHVRPLMTGYGYTRVRGPVSATFDVIGGIAFNSFSLASPATEAYRERLGAQSINTHVSKSPVVKPEVDLWIDVSRRVGLNINAGYLIARPQIAVRSTLGDDIRRARADMFTLTIGAVYSLF